MDITYTSVHIPLINFVLLIQFHTIRICCPHARWASPTDTLYPVSIIHTLHIIHFTQFTNFIRFISFCIIQSLKFVYLHPRKGFKSNSPMHTFGRYTGPRQGICGLLLFPLVQSSSLQSLYFRSRRHHLSRSSLFARDVGYHLFRLVTL